jgi:D-beta-D-heptose 7-phosphate kinase/D-beta-D-heptose 1-phosphate adenosyltransferase
MNIVVTSGGFDPIHPGHILYLQNAATHGDKHICIVNSDKFLDKKKGYHVQDWIARMTILLNIKGVDHVVPAIDEDETVCQTLQWIRAEFPNDTIFFCKGGDRKGNEIPEKDVCDKLGIIIWDGMGGYDKVDSSQAIIRRLRDE